MGELRRFRLEAEVTFGEVGGTLPWESELQEEILTTLEDLGGLEIELEIEEL